MTNDFFNINTRQVIGIILDIKTELVTPDVINVMIVCGKGFINPKLREKVFKFADEIYHELVEDVEKTDGTNS